MPFDKNYNFINYYKETIYRVIYLNEILIFKCKDKHVTYNLKNNFVHLLRLQRYLRSIHFHIDVFRLMTFSCI